MSRMSYPEASDPFFELFEKLASNAVLASRQFTTMLADYGNRTEHFDTIFNIEREADLIVHEIIQMAHRSYTTPIARDDVRSLTSLLDDLVDQVEATADRLILYNIETIRPDLVDLAEILLGATQEVVLAVGELKHLSHPEKLAEHCIKVNSIENEGDKVGRKALAALFSEPDIQALEALKWREIYDYIEMAIDLCEDVGDLLEGIVLKRSS